jgi:hypothetical protein
MNSIITDYGHQLADFDLEINLINNQLIKYAQQFFGKDNVPDKFVKDILKMSLNDKIWLLTQYKEEVKEQATPNLSMLV